jgi:excisionase family DNA binding protein
MSSIAFEVTRSTPYDDLPQWLTARETAKILDVSVWFVYENVKQGHIPARKIGSKIIQIPREFFHPDNAHKAVTA